MCAVAAAHSLGEFVGFDVELDGRFGLAVLVFGHKLVVARVLADEAVDLEYERVRLALGDKSVDSIKVSASSSVFSPKMIRLKYVLVRVVHTVVCVCCRF